MIINEVMPIEVSLNMPDKFTKILNEMTIKLIKPIPKPSYTNILRGLNKEFYHKTVTTKEIENYISKSMNVDLSKVFNQYFIHAEYQTLSNEEGYDIDYVNNKVLTLRSWDDHFFIGGGYGASGGGIGFQISILWDVLQEFSSTNLPIQYRMGINYKF